MNEETEHITKWLQDVIDEEEPEEDVISAKELLSRLDDIFVQRDKNPLTKVEELEECNYDHIDGRLNNQKTQESITEKLKKNAPYFMEAVKVRYLFYLLMNISAALGYNVQ